MSDDLIKRSDVLFMIDAFERDFQQSWRVQFRADVDAIPAIKDDRIEELESEVKQWHSEAMAWIEKWGAAEAKLAKAVEVLQEIITRWDTPTWKDAEATGGVINRARTVLAELEGKE
jgi:hypothetical protein